MNWSVPEAKNSPISVEEKIAEIRRRSHLIELGSESQRVTSPQRYRSKVLREPPRGPGSNVQSAPSSVHFLSSGGGGRRADERNTVLVRRVEGFHMGPQHRLREARSCIVLRGKESPKGNGPRGRHQVAWIHRLHESCATDGGGRVLGREAAQAGKSFIHRMAWACRSDPNRECRTSPTVELRLRIILRTTKA